MTFNKHVPYFAMPTVKHSRISAFIRINHISTWLLLLLKGWQKLQKNEVKFLHNF